MVGSHLAAAGSSSEADFQGEVEEARSRIVVGFVR